MPKLFGIDIAGEIAKGFAAAGNLVPGTLTKVTPGTRDVNNPRQGTNPTTTAHTFQGFLEKTSKRLPESRVTVTGEFVTMLGGSITPSAEPSQGDRVTIEGLTFEITKVVSRDPAGATFVAMVERR